VLPTGPDHEVTPTTAATLEDAAAPPPGPPEGDVPEPFSERPDIPGYAVLEPIGYGGMAEVWLADKESSAGVPVRCVLKTILPEHLEHGRYVERFLDEARIVAQLRHPNICSVIDVGRTDDRIWLAMEWVDGVDAAEMMRRVRRRSSELPLRHALYVLRETLQGLHHAHTAVDDAGRPLEIIHRDVSPGNLLISRDGSVQLTDFGVAQGTVAQRIERKGALAGKLHYFAPELFRGPRVATQASDLFALSVSFWEMLTVKPMFSRKLTPKELRRTIESFDIDQLLEEDLTVPEGLEPILRRGLAGDVETRYSTALEMLEDVNDYAYESGLRLLGAHFAEWLGRLLSPPAERKGRRSFLAGLKEPKDA